MNAEQEALLREIYEMVGGEESGITLDEARELMELANNIPLDTISVGLHEMFDHQPIVGEGLFLAGMPKRKH
jgi:hypothetical protein